MTSSQLKLFVSGRPLNLGKRVGKGGEGEVYLLADNPQQAAKIYTLNDLTTRSAKVSSMVNASLHKKTDFVAFPREVITDLKGSFRGFTMRAISGSKPLHELYAPGSRKKHFPSVDYRFLVRAALNTARAVASVHESGCVIGDINHSGILISDQALVTLIDADSFQFSHQGKTHLCKVGVPEYTPPELQGKDLGATTRSPVHDCFGLAVVVFQLLFMGRHPFVGTVRRGDVPELDRNIREFRYAYSNLRDIGLDQPPGTPDIDDFSGPIARALEQSFGPSGQKVRPSASEWVGILQSLESSLVKCTRDTSHYYSRDSSDCPWCEMEAALSVFLFIPQFSMAGTPGMQGDPGEVGFNLEATARLIEQIQIPPPTSFPGLFGNLNLSPSKAASEEKGKKNPKFLIGVGIVGAVALLFFNAPELFILYIIAGWIGFGFINSNPGIDKGKFLESYRQAAANWNQLLYSYQTSIGFFELEKSKAEALEATRQYRELKTDLQQALSVLSSNRRDRQLHAHLDRFELRSAKIKGIGPSKVAVLVSYGIDTAAEIDARKILQIPGFGPAYTNALVTWRKSMEAKFIFRDVVTQDEVDQANRLKMQSAQQGATLRQKIASAPRQLSSLRDGVAKSLQSPPAALVAARKALEQGKVDLSHLGIPVPAISHAQPASPPARSVTPFSSPTSKPSPSPSVRTSGLSCPRCGSSMTRRTARKGRNAGSGFWGCTRFPHCRGTRPL